MVQTTTSTLQLWEQNMYQRSDELRTTSNSGHHFARSQAQRFCFVRPPKFLTKRWFLLPIVWLSKITQSYQSNTTSEAFCRCTTERVRGKTRQWTVKEQSSFFLSLRAREGKKTIDQYTQHSLPYYAVPYARPFTLATKGDGRQRGRPRWMIRKLI